MQITLEMVDEIINRTGATYKEAKEALEACDGDILKALVYMEDLKTETSEPKADRRLNGQEIVNKLKALVNEGIVTQIIIERNDRKVLDIPVVAGALTAVIFTVPTVAGIIAAVATGCTIKIVKEDGDIVNINEFTQEKFDQVFKSHKTEESEESDEEATEIYPEETVEKNDEEKDEWYQS
ncbi:DUF4342 domain-containing protein [Fusibacter paucivorans]|uniref:DUF4342 domain-containing protein n=1 Tax=Fusibacter paucivorans TaxID=76009 RepID=A0ABS5PPD6_9FIRM|nr:DUF4342 domain-containing protein [Fusibacter paucivorans]MBS7526762.1 DUF4342 domain-containing protein [Fusibacter paucivorans]